MLTENYKIVKQNIAEAARRTGRDPGAVKLVAVTKTVGITEINMAVQLGISDFGENRVQSAREKVERIRTVNWHFIGHLQSNKVKDVIPYYALIHSLDRISLADELQRCAEKQDIHIAVLIQVNISGESSKYGLNPDRLQEFLSQIKGYDRLQVRGLMTMAPFFEDQEEARTCFRELRLLRDESRDSGFDLLELSMGMTNDYIVAVEEGSTMVRIGTALFHG